MGRRAEGCQVIAKATWGKPIAAARLTDSHRSSASQHIERTNSMEQEPNDKQSVRSAAIATLLSASAGSGIGWVLWLVTGNIAVAIGIAGPMAALTNNFLRNAIK